MRMLICYAALLVTLAVGADEEAVRPDGRRAAGALTLDAKGRLRFTPKGADAPLPPDEVALVRFPKATVPANRSCYGVRVTLHDGQHIAGQLLALDDKTLSLWPAWAEKVELPRAAVASVTQLPGWRTVAVEDFRDGGKAWTIAGKPNFDAKDGTVTLNDKGQSLMYALTASLGGGRVGVTFADAEAAGGHWTVEAEFGDDKNRRSLRVTVADAGGAYEVDSVGLDGVSRRAARTPGPHRLLIQFAPRSLRITVDDQALWHNLDAGPGGPLRQVRLACTADKDKVQGAVAFSEFFLARAVDEPRRPTGDATQDEVWRSDGDQLFGRVLRAGGQSVEIDCDGRRALAWPAVHGVWLRRAAAPPRTSDGAHVRVAVRTCLSIEPDLLDGVVTALDDKALSLKHTLLGDVRLERARLHTLRPLFHGRRIEVDNAFHHLGDPEAFAPQLQPPRAEGPTLKRTFTLDVLPGEARLVLEVVRLKGPKETASRATLYLNGERLDDLNRHVDKAVDEPRRLALPLPKERLRKGENVLELRLTPSPETRRVEPCGVSGLAIELPR
jgi:hypothetical protein